MLATFGTVIYRGSEKDGRVRSWLCGASSLGVVLDERRISGDQKVRGYCAEPEAVIMPGQHKGSHKSTDPDDVQRVAGEKVAPRPVS